MYTEDQKQEFRDVAEPLVKWLCENGHPHMTIIVTQTHAELLEGEMNFYTEDHLVD